MASRRSLSCDAVPSPFRLKFFSSSVASRRSLSYNGRHVQQASRGSSRRSRRRSRSLGRDDDHDDDDEQNQRQFRPIRQPQQRSFGSGAWQASRRLLVTIIFFIPQEAKDLLAGVLLREIVASLAMSDDSCQRCPLALHLQSVVEPVREK